MSADTDDIVLAAVDRPRHGGAAAQGAGPRRGRRARRGSTAVARVVASVGVPVLFLGGPHRGEAADARSLDEVRRRHGRGGAGLAIGPGHLPGAVAPGRWPQQVADDRAPAPVILTVDLGTSVTKVALWDRTTGWWPWPGAPAGHRPPGAGLGRAGPGGVVDVGGGGLRASAPRGAPAAFGRRSRWWAAPAARQTFVPGRRGRRPARAGDRVVGPPGRGRGGAAGRRSVGRRPSARRRTGIAARRGLGGGQARPGWPATSPGGSTPRLGPDPEGPGGVAADRRGGHRPHHGLAQPGSTTPTAELVGRPGRRRPPGMLPPVVASDQVAGALTRGAGGRTRADRGDPGGHRGRRPGLRGARRRRLPTRPMVSWGTTANVSVPVADRPDPPPAGGGRRGRPTGAGCSRAGCRRPARSLAWLGAPHRSSGPPTLAARAAAQPARGPRAWWPCPGSTGPGPRGGATRPRAAFVGLALGPRRRRSGPGRLRVGGLGGAALPGGRRRAPAGGRRRRSGWPWAAPGAAIPVWIEVLTGVTGLPVQRRRSGQAASAGAALLAARPPSASSCGSRPARPRRRRRRARPGRVDRYARAACRRPTGRPAAVIGRTVAGSSPARDPGSQPCGVTLAYGTDGLEVEVPDDAVVVEPSEPARPGRRGRGGPARPGRSPVVRTAAAPSWSRAGRPGGGGLPRHHPADAQPTVLPPLLAELERGRRRARPGRAAVRHRHPPRGHRRAEMAELVGAGHRRRGTGSTSTGPTTPTTSRWGRSTASPSCSTAATSRPTSASSPGSSSPTSSPGWSGGPKGLCPGLAATATILEAHSPAPDRRRPVHLAGHRGQPGARLRARRHRPVPARPVARRGHRRPAPAHRGVRRRRCPTATAPPARSSPTRVVAVGGRPLRRGAHHQRRLSARPQPLPGGQGDGRGRAGGRPTAASS